MLTFENQPTQGAAPIVQKLSVCLPPRCPTIGNKGLTYDLDRNFPSRKLLIGSTRSMPNLEVMGPLW